ncbi:AAA family ATPase [Mesorhizobium sp. M2A.F.Ca.ET.067.02.1.1]|uniref:AAA family ATPase n=1 Tax=Mesorhizobium sp. M2A.F.Ca.ET.067.02.1.1 TaxID=2496749 RepID=UPI000FD189BE|nr:AAA family ATPase [Mesorhizobium sp. M2A.F.Ca.ET.067.02.1.1]RUW81286.1 hypothetical protein EOA28_01870 [Mesorhizobium sp. M2A.F.Ca.ET.067.02.1.1]TIU59182.1 MAG: hypothetical protein E5W35_00090 [Mesorhizobium sp.]
MTMFVETRAALTVRAAFDTAVKMRYPVLAVGKAGLGKTVALNWIAAQSGAAYCEVAQHTKAIRPMFLMLHDAYGVQRDSKHTYDLAKDCMNFLGARYGPTRPLLVDEYQNFTPTVLRELLHLQERCGFALLLAGNTHRLAGTRRDTHAVDQIESRIGMRFEIGQPTREDCVRIGAEHNVEGADAYEAIATYGQNTSLRALCHLLQNCAADTSGDGSIRLPRIETMLRVMSCGSDALKLLHERRNDFAHDVSGRT